MRWLSIPKTRLGGVFSKFFFDLIRVEFPSRKELAQWTEADIANCWVGFSVKDDCQTKTFAYPGILGECFCEIRWHQSHKRLFSREKLVKWYSARIWTDVLCRKTECSLTETLWQPQLVAQAATQGAIRALATTCGWDTRILNEPDFLEPDHWAVGLPLVPCFWFVLIRHWKSSWASLSMETGGRSRTLGARLLQNVSGCASSVFQVPFVKLGDGLDSTVTQILDTIESSQVQVYII